MYVYIESYLSSNECVAVKKVGVYCPVAPA